MKTTIKIHDTQWFKKHCESYYQFSRLMPKYDSWSPAQTIHWILGMRSLEGKVLEVEHDCGNKAGYINDARYMAEGFYIPNWAIEWVKEEQE